MSGRTGTHKKDCVTLSISERSLFITLTAYREAGHGIPYYQFIHLVFPLLGRDSRTNKQKTGFMCVETFQSFRCRDTHSNTRTRTSRGKMRGCFSPGYPKGRERTCQTKQWLPWRHKSSVSGLLKGSGTVAPGYLARRQQVTCEESQ